MVVVVVATWVGRRRSIHPELEHKFGRGQRYRQDATHKNNTCMRMSKKMTELSHLDGSQGSITILTQPYAAVAHLDPPPSASITEVKRIGRINKSAIMPRAHPSPGRRRHRSHTDAPVCHSICLGHCARTSTVQNTRPAKRV